MQDFRQARVQADKQVAGSHQGQSGRCHHAPPIDLGIGLGSAQARFHEFQIFDDFGHHLLDLRQLAGA
jgi:hypothetical protein